MKSKITYIHDMQTENSQFKKGKVDYTISVGTKQRRSLWYKRYAAVLVMTHKDNP